MTGAERKHAASILELVARFGGIDGAHHKQWVIDQLLRHLLGHLYAAWVEEYNAPPDYDDWDVGIAP